MGKFKTLALSLGVTAICLGAIAGALAAFGVHSIISIAVLNWMILACIATLTLLYHVAFPPAYYAAQPFEGTGRLYEYLGVRACKALLRRGPLRILSPKLHMPKEKTVAALQALEGEMRLAETVHVITFVLMMIVIGYEAANGWFDTVLWMLLINILFNVYPVMLQRYNRIKLQDLMRRQAG